MTKKDQESNTYLFFWGGIYSNWHKAPMVIKGDTYNCVEQFMMSTKAILHYDWETAEKIHNETNPRKQKELGRQVKNFNPKVWDNFKYNIVKTGVKAKFSQNPELLTQLYQDRNKIFVEASPYDRIWGIGFSEKEALANIDLWGENLLGHIIKEVATELF